MTRPTKRWSPPNHPTYIVASAALKQARTLNDRGAVQGALFEYLLSRYLFAPLRGPAGADRRRRRVAAARAALSAASITASRNSFCSSQTKACLAACRHSARRRGGDRRRLPAYLAAIAPPVPRPPPRRPPASRSRWSAGRSRETSRIQQVCWYATSRRSFGDRVKVSVEEYGDSRDGAALRRPPLPGGVRRRRAVCAAEGFRLRRHGRRQRRPLRAVARSRQSAPLQGRSAPHSSPGGSPAKRSRGSTSPTWRARPTRPTAPRRCRR